MVYLEQCCLMWVCTALLNGPCCCLFFLYGGFTLLLIPIFFLLTIPPLLIVGLMKVIPLCRRYTGTLFLFSVFLASLTEVIPVLRKFHFAAWISLILCTIIFFFFCFCQRVKNLKFWSSMSSLLLPPSSLFFSPRACQVFLSFCFRWRRVYSLPKTYSFCLLFLKKRKYFLVFSMLLSI